MASEAQRQQQLINSGFLNNLGSTDQGLELDTVEQVFVKYMGKIVQRLTDRIDQAGPDGREISATGNLSSNIRFEYTKSAVRYAGQILMPDYADYRDKGIRGLGADNQNTTSPYRFKFLRPSKKHVAAIEQWIKDKNNLAIVTAPKGLTDIVAEQKSLAYIFAASARRKGIKAANFKKDVLKDIMPDFARDIGIAMGKDIAVSIRLAKLR